MSVKDILFKGSMVRAILDDIKIETRRILKPQPSPVGGKIPGAIFSNDFHWPTGLGMGVVSCKPFPPEKYLKKYPLRYQVGDVLWVRETWRADARFDHKSPSEITSAHPNITYLATSGPDYFNVEGKTRVSIHMPRRFSRLTLKVTGVKVQRLQEITDKEALNEGVEAAVAPVAGQDICIDGEYWPGGPRRMFKQLWDSINEKRGFSWDDNPWVAAYTFKVHKCNIDTYLAEVAA